MKATLADWDPRKDETDPLAGLIKVALAMHDGRPALDQRLAELAGGYPSGHTGGGRGDDEDKPAPAGDVADRERREFYRELQSSFDAACRAWARYKRLAEPRGGVAKLTDPGCELCAQVPGHWCPVFGVRVILTEPATKRERPKVSPIRLCEWCYRCTWESRMGRLPTLAEVEAHSEGRRVLWRGGVEARLVEVACPDCRDENRAARRACRTCGHSGKVLKSA